MDARSTAKVSDRSRCFNRIRELVCDALDESAMRWLVMSALQSSTFTVIREPKEPTRRRHGRHARWGCRQTAASGSPEWRCSGCDQQVVDSANSGCWSGVLTPGSHGRVVFGRFGRRPWRCLAVSFGHEIGHDWHPQRGYEGPWNYQGVAVSGGFRGWMRAVQPSRKSLSTQVFQGSNPLLSATTSLGATGMVPIWWVGDETAC